ncbi:MAG: LPS export ABC transporter permease LptG [Rubrivivax sp.]|nr:LPS export ABC transporter permease LptG [Rubrivivax sp.]
MKTVRRLLYRDIVASVAFVAVAFLSLFFFIDFVEELESAGRSGRAAWSAALAAGFSVPGHFYELFPIAVLIGSIYSMSRLAQSSEFVILRTGGLGPGRALALLTSLGLAFGLATWLVGDYLAPASERQGVLFKASNSGKDYSGAGVWLKERRSTPQGDFNYSVNVQATNPLGGMSGIRIYEFDPTGHLSTRIEANEARVGEGGTWTLSHARTMHWPAPRAEAPSALRVEQHATLKWPSTLTLGMVTAAVLPVGTMTTAELWRFSRHLSTQEQAAEGHQIQFWKRALYPLACLVMVALALPFAYTHARAGSVSLKVFGGIMLGISFVLLNNLAGHMGLLRGWTPWVAAATPSLIYLGLSMAAFAWLVRYR